DELHGVGVLADERAPARLCPACGEPVGAEPGGPRRRFRRAQAVLRVCLRGLQHLLEAKRVPCGRWVERPAFSPGHINRSGLHVNPLPSSASAAAAQASPDRNTRSTAASTASPKAAPPAMSSGRWAPT